MTRTGSFIGRLAQSGGLYHPAAIRIETRHTRRARRSVVPLSLTTFVPAPMVLMAIFPAGGAQDVSHGWNQASWPHPLPLTGAHNVEIVFMQGEGWGGG